MVYPNACCNVSVDISKANLQVANALPRYSRETSLFTARLIGQVSDGDVKEECLNASPSSTSEMNLHRLFQIVRRKNSSLLNRRAKIATIGRVIPMHLVHQARLRMQARRNKVQCRRKVLFETHPQRVGNGNLSASKSVPTRSNYCAGIVSSASRRFTLLLITIFSAWNTRCTAAPALKPIEESFALRQNTYHCHLLIPLEMPISSHQLHLPKNLKHEMLQTVRRPRPKTLRKNTRIPI